MKKVLLFEDYLNENSAWKKANKKAEDLFGELGIASLDDSQLADIIDIEAADKLADKMFGEFGFLSLSEEDMEKLLTKNPKLLKESVNEGKGWAKLMKAVRSGSKSGPWSIVSIEGGKVVNQELVKIMDLIPAKYEDVKKRFPNAKMSIEDNEGMQVYNEALVNEAEKTIKGNFGVKKVQTLIDKYGRDNGLFFRRKSDGKLYGVGSIFLDSSEKDFAVIDADGYEDYIDYKDIDYIVIEKSVVTEGKTSAVYTDPNTGKKYDLQYVSTKKRWELDIMKKGASIYSSAITTIKRDTLAEIQEWLDGYKIDSSWTKGLSESLVTEAKFKVGDTWEWKTSNGTKIVKITNIKPNGDVISREDGTSQDFIVRDADKFLKKKVN